MEKIVEETFKVFSHLARDIQNYIIAGFILLCNFYLIDRTYYSQDFSTLILTSDYLILILIITSYVLGHICLAFYAFILEQTSWDKKLYNKIFKKRFSSVTAATDESLMEEKGKIFIANKEAYFHFIERDVNLSTLRWNYSSAFLLCCLVNIIYCGFKNLEPEILISAVIYFFVSWWLMVLHIFTQKETAYQVQKLKDVIDVNKSNALLNSIEKKIDALTEIVKSN